MRILLICEHAEKTDGWGTYSRNLHDVLVQRGHEVHLCCARGSTDLRCYPILSEPLKYLTNPVVPWLSAKNLHKVIQKLQPDVIHITVEPYAMMIPYLPSSIARQTLLTVHGSYGIRPLTMRLTKRNAVKYYENISNFITVSQYTKQKVADFLHSLNETKAAENFFGNSEVIHNGIILPPWKPREQSDRPKEILLVGGVKPRKGILQAIEACAVFKKISQAPFHFSIVGSYKEDAYLRQVQERLMTLKLTNEVRILGHIPQQELELLYEKADLYLMPSMTEQDNFEGFGIVFLEANAYGIPCIGPDESGAAEAIEGGVSGYKVDPNDAEKIAERMSWILDEGRISAEKCRKWAESHSAENVGMKVEKAYELLHSGT